MQQDGPTGAGRRSTGRVGVREVAKRAGVSTQTVSRVLNNSTKLRAQTRDRVLAAMAELEYRPNNAARALGTATTRTLGVIATDTTLYGPSIAIAELAAAARAGGRWIATAYADAEDETSVEDALEHVLGQGVDGLVLVAPHRGTREQLAARGTDLPLVVMHGGPVDQQARASGLVVEHLVGLGHRRIGRLGGPQEWLEETSRRQGFDTALERAGLTVSVHASGDWSAASGALAAPTFVDLVRSSDGPTAIVVANDQMALGLMSALAAAGIDVPGDVSVTGFDDNPDAAHYRPALTTVRLDLPGEARRCVAEAFGDPDVPGPQAPRLVVRDSAAAPR